MKWPAFPRWPGRNAQPPPRGDYGRRLGRDRLPRPTPVSLLSHFIGVPMLLLIGINIAFDLLCYLVIRQLVNLWEYAFVWRGRAAALRRRMRNATSYDEWRAAAHALDAFMDNDRWKEQDQSAFFDWELVRDLVEGLDTAMAQDKPDAVIRLLLQGGIRPNFGGVENDLVYSQCYTGTKRLVERYVAAVQRALEYLSAHPQLKSEEKAQFFKLALRMYGRTALCLSGGASFGYFHLGVLKTLLEQDLLPTVVAGTSAGSLMACLVGCWPEKELRAALTPEFFVHLTACADDWLVRGRRWLRTGAMFDLDDWYKKSLYFTRGTTTFREAFERTGRVLNISVVPDHAGAPAKLLNYVTAPDVVIASAVLASSAVPHFLQPVELVMKQSDGSLTRYSGGGRLWRDGSLRTDIPTTTLDSLFNVKFTVVSQVNPHVVVFFYDSRGSPGRPVAHRRGRGWRGGFLLSSMELLFKLDLQKLLRLLRDLDLLPSILSLVFLQRFHGSVTILPRVQLWHYLRILADPGSAAVMAEYMRTGEQRTWPRIQWISNRLAIERALAQGRRSARCGALRDVPAGLPPSIVVEAAESPVALALAEPVDLDTPPTAQSPLVGGSRESVSGGHLGVKTASFRRASINGQSAAASDSSSKSDTDGDNCAPPDSLSSSLISSMVSPRGSPQSTLYSRAGFFSATDSELDFLASVNAGHSPDFGGVGPGLAADPRFELGSEDLLDNTPPNGRALSE